MILFAHTESAEQIWKRVTEKFKPWSSVYFKQKQFKWLSQSVKGTKRNKFVLQLNKGNSKNWKPDSFIFVGNFHLICPRFLRGNCRNFHLVEDNHLCLESWKLVSWPRVEFCFVLFFWGGEGFHIKDSFFSVVNCLKERRGARAGGKFRPSENSYLAVAFDVWWTGH